MINSNKITKIVRKTVFPFFVDVFLSGNPQYFYLYHRLTAPKVHVHLMVFYYLFYSRIVPPKILSFAIIPQLFINCSLKKDYFYSLNNLIKMSSHCSGISFSSGDCTICRLKLSKDKPQQSQQLSGDDFVTSSEKYL